MRFENFSFSGHESFPLRFSWLKKGYEQVLISPTFFGSDEAMTILGVGKNMVRSIRHWGGACGIWEDRRKRGKELYPTEFGSRLLSNDGWDPFMEDLGTIWLLHWKLVANPSKATSWSYVFGSGKPNQMARQEVVKELYEMAKEGNVARANHGTIKRDLDVLLRSYIPGKRKAGRVVEESLDSPFVLLNLVRDTHESGVFEVVQGLHRSLPDAIFEYALADYCERFRESGTKILPLDELMYGAFSPGRVFRLTEGELVQRLNRIVGKNARKYAFDETAGLRQLMVYEHNDTGTTCLETYYHVAGKGRAA